MTTNIPSAALVAVVPLFSEPERLALAGFLASYTGLTREAYTLDLRQFAAQTAQLPDGSVSAGTAASTSAAAADRHARGLGFESP